MADQKRKLYELKDGAFDSSEGAWATISRHLQVVADNVPLSNYFFKHQKELGLFSAAAFRRWRIKKATWARMSTQPRFC
jgi:hypothetical protein